MSESRKHYRGVARQGRHVAVEVRLAGRASVAARTRDIGVGGAFILSNDPFLPGSHIEVVLQVAPEAPLVLGAEVRWIEPGHGMGIRFDTLAVDDLLVLGEYLSTIAVER
jgi:hypothetical protein